MKYDDIHQQVRRYYRKKIQTHGTVAQGVDWNSPESQRLRFEQLVKICDRNLTFEVNDYGCGYGALADYLREKGYAFSYRGFDLCSQMIASARKLHAATDRVVFVGADSEMSQADYTLASGIFNVKLLTPTEQWEEYLLHTLRSIDSLSTRGFAFNALTKYSDAEFRRSDLYYADPLFLFNYCKTAFSRFVSLIHDYPLYEFTILVRKE
jgi:hypothetical protein